MLYDKIDVLLSMLYVSMVVMRDILDLVCVCMRNTSTGSPAAVYLGCNRVHERGFIGI